MTGTVGALTKMGEFKLVTNKTPKSDEEDTDHIKRAEQEQALDEALKNTFPASDPISMEQPVPPSRSRIDENPGADVRPPLGSFRPIGSATSQTILKHPLEHARILARNLLRADSSSTRSMPSSKEPSFTINSSQCRGHHVSFHPAELLPPCPQARLQPPLHRCVQGVR